MFYKLNLKNETCLLLSVRDTRKMCIMELFRNETRVRI